MVSENWVLRRIHVLRRKGVGGWRRLHNEDLHKLYASTNITVIKSRGYDGKVMYHAWKR
jgi:hypothetical protein